MRTFSMKVVVPFLFSILFMLWGVAPCFGSNEPEKEGRTLLSHAADLVDLESGESAPFMMMANVKLVDGKKSVEGIYAIASAGPGQFRRVFRLPNFNSTEVLEDGIIYRHRSVEALPLLIWEAEKLVAPSSQYRLNKKQKIKRVEESQVGAVRLKCVITSDEVQTSRFCVDAATGTPYSIDRGIDVRYSESLREHFEFSDYEVFQDRLFPRKLTFRGWDSQVIEVRIDKLLPARSFPETEFTPPEESIRMPYCRSPEREGELRPSTGSTIPIGFRDLRIDMYFQASPAGGVQYAQVVYSSDPLHSKEVLNWFIGTHFPIEKCSGIPISYEMITTLARGH